GLNVRPALLQQLDGLDGLDAVAPRLFLSGAEGERQAVDEDVALAHAVLADERVDGALRDRNLLVRRTRLSLFADLQPHDSRDVLDDDRHDAAVAALGSVAVLEVDRVDDRAAAEAL